MHAQLTVTPARLPEVLLWGAPGIGKSSLVRRFAASAPTSCRPARW